MKSLELNIPKSLQFISIYYLCPRSGHSYLSVAGVTVRYPLSYSYANILSEGMPFFVILEVFLYLHFKTIGKYLAEMSLGFWYVYISERLREWGGSQREKGREKKKN